jgi:hypothetical protein
MINPLTPELNPSAQSGLLRFFLMGILIFKRFTARRLYKPFGVKGLIVLFLNIMTLVSQIEERNCIWLTSSDLV